MEHQIFGQMRTGVFIHSLSEKQLLNSIRSGMSMITDGPVANMRVISSDHKMSSLGCAYSGTRHTVLLELLSSTEYGSIEWFKVLRGNIGQQETEFVFEKEVNGYSLDLKFSFTTESESYIRAEIWTSAKDSRDGQPHFCITNPIWFTQE